MGLETIKYYSGRLHRLSEGISFPVPKLNNLLAVVTEILGDDRNAKKNQ